MASKMGKRFTDTEKYKKPFIRGLKGAYKLLWDYICLDCNHAGIWIVDFEVAQLYIGNDMQVNKKEALECFNKSEERVIPFDNGTKWFIKSFVEFQYGTLSEKIRSHKSVIDILEKNKLIKFVVCDKGLANPLNTSLQGCKDKDTYKDKDKEYLGESAERGACSQVFTHPKNAKEVISEAEKICYVMSDETATRFIATYSATGWMLRGQAITNWRSLLPIWKANESNFKKAPTAGKNVDPMNPETWEKLPESEAV